MARPIGEKIISAISATNGLCKHGQGTRAKAARNGVSAPPGPDHNEPNKEAQMALKPDMRASDSAQPKFYSGHEGESQ